MILNVILVNNLSGGLVSCRDHVKSQADFGKNLSNYRIENTSKYMNEKVLRKTGNLFCSNELKPLKLRTATVLVLTTSST